MIQQAHHRISRPAAVLIGISLIIITLASGKNIFETFPLTQILWTFVALLGLLVLLGYIFQNKIVGYIGERHTENFLF